MLAILIVRTSPSMMDKVIERGKTQSVTRTAHLQIITTTLSDKLFQLHIIWKLFAIVEAVIFISLGRLVGFLSYLNDILLRD